MTLQLTNHQIGLAAAGAAALGLSLADGLLQPVGRLAELRRSLRKTSTPPAGQGATPAPASTPAYPPAAPVDTAGALAHFGLTL